MMAIARRCLPIQMRSKSRWNSLQQGGYLCHELNGVTVGFSAIAPRVDGETELDALFVEPNIRRHGIGRLMVEYCAEVARKQGSASLHVTGNPHAEDFYLACGFKQIGTIQTRFGVGLLLRKGLSVGPQSSAPLR
jgi:GNAT superfamily N-acetyltransferase